MYRWLDSHLDFSKYTYTYVGNLNGVKFRNIKHVKPVASEKLADLLASADMYITASKLEPASNSLLEAMQVGLPIVYQAGSGHDSIVLDAGEPFDGPGQSLLDAIDRVASRLDYYSKNILMHDIDHIADMYLDVMDYCMQFPRFSPSN